MLVSILIPLFNGIEFFNECYNSVLSQTYQDFEILIGINGHYTDLVFYERVKNIVNNNNKTKIFNLEIKNKVETLNFLIKKINGDVVCLLDADDYWKKNKLEEQIKVKLNDKNINVIGTQCNYIINNKITNIMPNIPVNYITDFKINPIINSSVMIDKKYCKWDNYNIHGEYLFGIEDYYLWLNLNLQKCIFYNIPESLVYHRLHKESSFNNKNNDLSALQYLIS